jgi:hypothetical protein
VVASVASPWVLPVLFGRVFDEAASAVAPLALAAVALGGWKLVVADLAGRGLTAVRPRTIGAGLVAMLAADCVLIPAFGIVGAGCGSVVGYAVAFGLALRSWTGLGGRLASIVALRGS